MRWLGLVVISFVGCGSSRPAVESSSPSADPASPRVEAAEGALPASADGTVRSLADSCASGRAAECLVLGVAHSDGTHGLPADQKKAADMYERACELGEIRGCNNLAVAFEKGKGRPVDLKSAVEIYARNCNEKHALACRNLGRSHRDGLGVPVDAKKAKAAFGEAKKLSESACKDRVAEGCSNLGFMFRSGDEGLPKDEPRAVQYLQRACDLGYKSICPLVHPSK